ncbi:hypothetical protein CBL_01255 [Carabus blaptoides fortunei]
MARSARSERRAFLLSRIKVGRQLLRVFAIPMPINCSDTDHRPHGLTSSNGNRTCAAFDVRNSPKVLEVSVDSRNDEETFGSAPNLMSLNSLDCLFSPLTGMRVAADVNVTSPNSRRRRRRLQPTPIADWKGIKREIMGSRVQEVKIHILLILLLFFQPKDCCRLGHVPCKIV